MAESSVGRKGLLAHASTLHKVSEGVRTGAHTGPEPEAGADAEALVGAAY